MLTSKRRMTYPMPFGRTPTERTRPAIELHLETSTTSARRDRSQFVLLMDGKGATRMKTTPAALGALALTALLTMTDRARADLIHWSYNWSRFPGEIKPDNPATGGKITLTDESLKSAVGDSDIVA